MQRDKVRRKTHRCRICGAYGVTHFHHIFGGARRKISERMDFVIELCPKCHRSAHTSVSFGDSLKHDCQLEWLETHTIDEWMEMMGKSWISDHELWALYNPIGSASVSQDGPDRFDDFQ